MRWTLPSALAVPHPAAAPARFGCGALVSTRVAVTGVLQRVERAGGADALEIDSALGRYRIVLRGRGTALVRHVGELVTVFALVSPLATGGLRSLRVERVTLHEV